MSSFNYTSHQLKLSLTSQLLLMIFYIFDKSYLWESKLERCPTAPPPPQGWIPTRRRRWGKRWSWSWGPDLLTVSLKYIFFPHFQNRRNPFTCSDKMITPGLNYQVLFEQGKSSFTPTLPYLWSSASACSSLDHFNICEQIFTWTSFIW